MTEKFPTTDAVFQHAVHILKQHHFDKAKLLKMRLENTDGIPPLEVHRIRIEAAAHEFITLSAARAEMSARRERGQRNRNSRIVNQALKNAGGGI